MTTEHFSEEEMLKCMNVAAGTFVAEITKLTLKYGMAEKYSRDAAQIALDGWFDVLSPESQ